MSGFFRRGLVSFATALTLLGATSAFAAGPGYTVVTPAEPSIPGKIEVIEFFWYGCPHCYHLEPALNAWIKRQGKDVVIRRIPATGDTGRRIHAALYYALLDNNLVEKLHDKVFDAIHKENLELRDVKVRTAFLQREGVDPNKINAAMMSFSVQSQLIQATRLGNAYNIQGVPSFVVNGKYLTSAYDAGGEDAMFNIMDQLVAKERAAKK